MLWNPSVNWFLKCMAYFPVETMIQTMVKPPACWKYYFSQVTEMLGFCMWVPDRASLQHHHVVKRGISEAEELFVPLLPWTWDKGLLMPQIVVTSSPRSQDTIWRNSVLVAQSSPAVCDPILQPSRPLCPWNSPGKNTGVGSHSLLQGIFLTQGLNPVSCTDRQILYLLSHQASPMAWNAHTAVGPEPSTRRTTRPYLLPVQPALPVWAVSGAWKQSLQEGEPCGEILSTLAAPRVDLFFHRKIDPLGNVSIMTLGNSRSCDGRARGSHRRA